MRKTLPVDAESLARGAGFGGSFVAAALIKQRKEAGRPRIQRIFGASPKRRAGEQLTISLGSQLAGAAAAAAATGAITGAQWYRDKKARFANARLIRQVIGAAAIAPDGAMTEESALIFRAAMGGTGLSHADLRRLDAEPPPASVRDLEPCPLQEPMLSAVATVAFSAMAAASGQTETARRFPALLLRLGLPRPTAEAAARQFADDYAGGRVVLSDHYPLLRPEPADARPRFELPVSQAVAGARLAIASSPGEQARQAGRQALVAIIGHGAQAILQSRVPLTPAVHAAVRLAGQPAGEQTPAAAPAPVRPSVHGELE